MLIAYRREVLPFFNYCSGLGLPISDMLMKILMWIKPKPALFHKYFISKNA